MAGRVSAGLAAQEGRRFGRTVGIAFFLLGSFFVWRDHTIPAQVCWGIAALLLVGAVVAPAQLKPVERAWMAMAHLISKVTTPIVMGVVYFLVVTPIALVVRVVKGNPLQRPHDGTGYWIPKGESSEHPTDMRRQF